MKYILLFLLSISILANLYLVSLHKQDESALKIVKEDEQAYWIFDSRINKNLIRLIDKDNDGHFDFIYLPIYDSNGNNVRDVIDYNYDGQPDIRVEMDGSGGYTWFEDNWYKIRNDKLTDKKYVTKGGIEVELTPDNSLLMQWQKKLFGKPTKPEK